MDDNINGKIAKDRDTWMGMEKTLFEGLLKEPKYKEMYEQFRKVPSHELHSKAMELIEEIESGKLLDWEIYLKVEEITLLLAAIEDAQRENIKERYWDGKEEEKKTKNINYSDQIIKRIKEIPKDKRQEILKKNGKKNIMKLLALLTLAGGVNKGTRIRPEVGTAERDSQEERENGEDNLHEKWIDSFRENPTYQIGRTEEEKSGEKEEQSRGRDR